MVVDSMRVVLRNFKREDIHFTQGQTEASILRFGYQLPGSLHTGMYVTGIEMLGTEGQKKEWIDMVVNGNMIGCYAQTEIGHGSDVQEL